MTKNSIKTLLLSDVLLYSALFLLLNIFSVAALTAILWFFGITVSAFHYFAGVFISLLVFLIIFKYYSLNIWLLPISALVSVILTAIAAFAVSRIFDFSFDSMAYHKLAIGLMSDGWNPISESSSEFIIRNNIFPDMNPDTQAIWIDHYAKLPWIFSSSLYKITGNLEATKVLPLIMTYVTFSFSYYYTRKRRWMVVVSAVFSLLLALTPVVFTQLFTFYIDGILASALTVLIISLLMITDGNHNSGKILKWLPVFLVISIIANIKFTGLAYAGVFIIVFYLIWGIRDIVLKRFSIKTFLKIAAVLIASVMFALFIIGFSTYVKNTVDHGNPLYPLFGEDKVDIMTFNEPDSYVVRSAAGKLFISTFCKCSNSVKDEPVLKNPFSYEDTELEHYCADTRMSGFGVFFGAIIILSAASFLFTLPAFYFKNRRIFAVALTLLVTISALLLAIGDSWWARYSPHFYFVPATAVFLMIELAICCKKKMFIFLTSVGALVLSGFMIFNMYTYFKAYLREERTEVYQTIAEQISVLDETIGEREFNVYIENQYAFGSLYNLRDFGLHFYVSPLEILDGEKLQIENFNMTIKFRD